MKNKLKYLDPVIVIGVIISVAVAIVLVLIGQDEAISLLIGLILTVITLLVDSIGKISENEDKILRALALETTLTRESALLTIITRISNDFGLVRSRNIAVLTDEANAALMKCQETMHSLAEGRMTTAIGDVNIGYATNSIQKAKSNVKAVAYADITFWQTQYGRYAFEQNVEAIKRGIKFTRIWVQTREILTQYKDILKNQSQSGIETFIVLPDEVSSSLLEDFRLIDDEIFIKMELYANGKAKSQYISVNPTDVSRAVNNFSLLLKHAHSYNDFFESE